MVASKVNDKEESTPLLMKILFTLLAVSWLLSVKWAFFVVVAKITFYTLCALFSLGLAAEIIKHAIVVIKKLSIRQERVALLNRIVHSVINSEFLHGFLGCLILTLMVFLVTTQIFHAEPQKIFEHIINYFLGNYFPQLHTLLAHCAR